MERAMSSRPTFTSRFEIDDERRIVVVCLTGDLDPSAVEDLHPQIQELIAAGFSRFTFDLSRLEHMGSIALRLFVALAKQLKETGGVALCGLPERLALLIDMTRVDRILKVYSTCELAMAALRNPGFRRPPVGLATQWRSTFRAASGPRRRPHRR
jgi:anti-anti-sigma factor